MAKRYNEWGEELTPEEEYEEDVREDDRKFRERNGLEDDDDYAAWQKGENWK